MVQTPCCSASSTRCGVAMVNVMLRSWAFSGLRFIMGLADPFGFGLRNTLAYMPPEFGSVTSSIASMASMCWTTGSHAVVFASDNLWYGGLYVSAGFVSKGSLNPFSTMSSTYLFCVTLRQLWGKQLSLPPL